MNGYQPFMLENAPYLTAVVLAVSGVLLVLSCVFYRVSVRWGVPISFVFLGIGMLAGSDGLGHIWFDRYDLAYVLGTMALAVILFSGGLNTSKKSIHAAIAPASVLATLGVVGVALVMAVGTRFILGLPWSESLLIGAIVSSTDAAAVYVVMPGLNLRGRLGPVVELESGLNDPVAIILTLSMTAHVLGESALGWHILTAIIQQLAIGLGGGLALGWMGRALLVHSRTFFHNTPAMFPVAALSMAMVAFGVPAWLDGSGFLSVYLAGIIIGNSNIPQKTYVKEFHDAISWLGQIMMFLILGLLVFPKQLPAVAWQGIALALFLAVVARPVVVTLCLLPFRFTGREIAYVSWAGLRGAVPIILATIPILRVDDQPQLFPLLQKLFNLIFFIVLVGAIIPGATLRWVTHKLKVCAPDPAGGHDHPQPAIGFH